MHWGGPRNAPLRMDRLNDQCCRGRGDFLELNSFRNHRRRRCVVRSHKPLSILLRACSGARQRLRVIAASRSFYSVFKVSPQDTQGKLLYALGDGQWDIPKLRLLLEKIIPEHGEMGNYVVKHEFPGIGHRTMHLNARQVFYEGGSDTTILLGLEDITGRRVLEREKEELLREKDVLLQELQHRVANSLQIIASIILMKAHKVDSEETRLHLQAPIRGSCRSRMCKSASIPRVWSGRSKWRLIFRGYVRDLRLQ